MKINPFIIGSGIALALAASFSAAAAPGEVIQGVEARALASPEYEVVTSITPFTMSEADRKLAAEVVQTLQQDHRIKGRIEVSAFNGQVALAGTVDTVPMIYRAVELADRNPAVREISVDRLEKH
jgi:osmotically-inducible protein OsmY